MNLISGIYHLCGGIHHSYERGTTHLFVVLNYLIITPQFNMKESFVINIQTNV
jgi:hypothetical protein